MEREEFSYDTKEAAEAFLDAIRYIDNGVQKDGGIEQKDDKFIAVVLIDSSEP